MRQGFTLVELIICAAIVLILGGMVLPFLIMAWRWFAHFLVGN